MSRDDAHDPTTASLRYRVGGWPNAVPFDPAIAERARHLRMNTPSHRILLRRLRCHGLGRSPLEAAGFLVASVACFAGFFVVMVVSGPFLAFSCIVVQFTMHGIDHGRRIRLETRPAYRAALRAAGLDVCVRCGHPMSHATPTSTCPECAFPHDDFPLDRDPSRPDDPGP